MTTEERIYAAVGLLQKVYSGGAYSNLGLSAADFKGEERDAAFVSRLYYGVLTKDTQLNYILSRLAERTPKPQIRILLKCAIYMLRYMDEPGYAVVSAAVDTAKRLGKKELAGFVNAVLRRQNSVSLPVRTGNRTFDASVNFSCPEWIIRNLDAARGEQFTDAFFSTELPTDTHVRHNPARISKEEFAALVPAARASGHGFYVPSSALASVDEGLYAVQAEASVRAAEYYCRGIEKGARVLDLCAAPGGKAVYVAQYSGASVTACDIHPHRVRLVRSYAEKTGAELKVAVNDATVRREEFVGAFDAVICDVPCSGLGVYKSKPDILLRRTEADMASLAGTQRKILSVAADYVRAGGILFYSTCTVTKEENEDMADAFLASRPDFAPWLLGESEREKSGRILLTPQDDGCEGFFVAAMRRTK